MGAEDPAGGGSPKALSALDLLSDHAHLAIVAELREGEAGVAEIARAVNRSPILVRQALASLRDAGLLRVRPDPRDRRRNLYSLDSRAARDLVAQVTSLLGLEPPSAAATPAVWNGQRWAPASGPSAAVGVLSTLPYFADLTAAELTDFAARADERSCKRGEMVFCEGQACQGLYVVKSGLVKVFKTSPDGKEQVLRLLGPGQAFNEASAFDGGPCPASAQAVEHSAVFVVPRAELLRLLHRSPAFAATAIRVMACHLRHLVSLVEDLSFRSVTGRVAKILLQTTQPADGVGAGADQRSRLTQQDIAQMAGTVREVVARALKTLEQAGAIRQRRGRIAILDAERLAAAASPTWGACCPPARPGLRCPPPKAVSSQVGGMRLRSQTARGG